MDGALSDCIERIRGAFAAGTPLRLRGGGSKDFYGEPAGGEVLDTRGLRGIRSYEPSELVVTVAAGTPLAELEEVLAREGQCLPFEPPHFGGGATVGGMVAAGLSGPARASVGSVRDYVLGLSMVNGRAELLTFGGQVMKNVAGYDVSRLMAGSLGTLGLIVEVSLKVLPRSPAEATLKFELSQRQALERLNAWGGQPLPLNASLWVQEPGGPALYLRLRGARAAVEAACKSLGGEPHDEAVQAAWRACRDQQLPWFAERGGRDLWRLSLPQTAPALDLPEAPLVEWHGAQRWVSAEAQDADRLRRVAAQSGGHATLFRAGPAGSRTQRFHPLQPPLDRIHVELKRQFDPAGIFNRGRLYPEL
ncbi:glycolate oxidase subunit GlcE [Ramlibacter henchirensis]|uniref:Glycolate oxidase subunit GlcE n=1 Tax=Ramlibacter henchirensis TaxID=204072 RepID=A0A4Z0C549_9BURK|nr:glycolate oxidase subunit GlcE [Ramlibacter henchirensis]TFZ06703.1 glycolate oxidase subunit GlcE [Ramlibacter henchirensis]